MSHPTFSDLMAYSDREMDAASSKRIEEHLSGCKECRDVLETQGHIEKAWRSSYVDPSDSEFTRLERSISGRMVRKPLFIRMLPVAAALLVALAGIRLMSTERGALGRQQPVPVPGTVAEAPETVLVVASSRLDEFQESGYGAAAEEQADLVQPGDSARIEANHDMEQAGVPGVAAQGIGGLGEAQQSQQAACGGAAGLVQSASGASGIEVEVVSQAPPTGGTIQAGGDAATGEVAALDQRIADAADSDNSGYVGNLLEAPGGGVFASEGTAGGGAALGATGVAADIASRDRVEDDRATETVTSEQASEAACCRSAALEDAHSGQLEGILPAAADMTVCFAFRAQVIFEFDSLGKPASPDSLLLDESFDGWKDSLEGRFVDSLVIVPLEDLTEFLE